MAYGAGHIKTFDGAEYTVNSEGEYVLVHKPETRFGRGFISPEVVIYGRLEHYPDRSVDYRKFF